ncbi:MAG: hypothetical protein WAT93_12780 [Pontixanthobacter sp.]
MKFDMGAAWNEAVRLVSANKEVLAIIAGVFFFLPSLALNVLAPATELEAAAGNPDQIRTALMAYFSNAWPFFLMYVIATYVGTLTLYALLGKQHQPTVGEAIKIGGSALVPYIASSLIVMLGLMVTVALVAGLSAATGSVALAVILGIAIAALFIFLSFRLVLVGPVMAIEGIYNPVAAIVRSWNLVKGNTRYLFAFVILLALAMGVVAGVLNLVITLFGAMMGAETALWVQAIFSGLLGSAMSVLMLSVYTAIHRQLAGATSKEDIQTFE